MRMDHFLSTVNRHDYICKYIYLIFTYESSRLQQTRVYKDNDISFFGPEILKLDNVFVKELTL